MHTANMPTPRITRRIHIAEMSPNEMDSVLSHPDRTNSFHKTEDSVVVPGQGSTRLPKMPGGRSVFEVNADQVMENALKESQGWRYLKRKSTFTVNDSSKSKLKLAHHTASKRSPSPTTTKKVKPNSHKLRGTQARGFQLGAWEGSSASGDQQKHTVLSFIDVSGRLQTRIRPNTKHGGHWLKAIRSLILVEVGLPLRISSFPIISLA